MFRIDWWLVRHGQNIHEILRWSGWDTGCYFRVTNPANAFSLKPWFVYLHRMLIQCKTLGMQNLDDVYCDIQYSMRLIEDTQGTTWSHRSLLLLEPWETPGALKGLADKGLRTQLAELATRDTSRSSLLSGDSRKIARKFQNINTSSPARMESPKQRWSKAIHSAASQVTLSFLTPPPFRLLFVLSSCSILASCSLCISSVLVVSLKKNTAATIPNTTTNNIIFFFMSLSLNQSKQI